MRKKIKTKLNLTEYQISDEALKTVINQVQLVSGKQLAAIFSKKNDSSYRAARSKGYGWKTYTDINHSGWGEGAENILGITAVD